MTKSRLEAFTDGVVAIVLTVLVLDIKIPDPSGFHSLWVIRNTLLAYANQFYICCGNLGEPSSYIPDGRTHQLPSGLVEYLLALLADLMSFRY